MKRFFALISASSIVFLGNTLPVFGASIFPDVPDGHIYKESIEALVGAQVINGNPDGNFYPERAVNRAEMLKMLYKAKGKVPDTTSTGCFPDVESGSWYESYVCDAAAERFVQGYSDGTFRPGTLVNRVEALKMITQVFGIRVDDITDADREIVKFVDVSTAAWYTKYLYTSFEKGILPIAGQTGARFYPDWPLLRGEAAAYIFNALGVQLTEERENTDAVESDEESSASDSQSDSSTQSSTATAQPVSMDVTFPFSKSGKFDEKQSYSFKFTIASTTVVSTEVALQSGQTGQVSCRLYLMKDSGFSSEYFLGFQDGKKCSLLTALKPGSYQLQLQPTVANTTFTVTTSETTGDGNDGFVQAARLIKGNVRTDTLTPNDLKDWFTFKVNEETNMTIDLSNSLELSCVVYSMEDVDLYGFTGPACNQTYTFPYGTYYVAVSRKHSRAEQQSYTILLR